MMNDEKYVFIQDVREKKITARSARHTRTHCGKGGAVKLPSDNMTKKELQAMNGEVKSYKLNQSMTWAEFKSMPDDIKITYIKLIREKYGAPDQHIGKMLGVCQTTIVNEIRRLGISNGKGCYKPKWNKEAFYAWVNGAPDTTADPVEDPQETAENPIPVPEAKTIPTQMPKASAIPNSGNLTFDGSAEAALNAVAVLLGGANVHITITWEVSTEEVAVSES